MTQETPPLTGRAERVLKRAREEQARHGHPVLTAVHVLYGLLTDKLCVALFVLRDMEVDAKALAARVHEEIEKGPPDPAANEQVLLAAATKWSQELKQVSVGTEHLLLALISAPSAAARWLAEAGAEQEQARAATEKLIDIVPRRSGPGFKPGEEEEEGR
ncbi:MAG TPA: Clp protease N-terminal domain-containing protein [Gemmatimonadales bacterium]|nr:Clp protease N-terminal domain-containing protein [Gemmatimonadales bacterium]